MMSNLGLLTKNLYLMPTLLILTENSLLRLPRLNAARLSRLSSITKQTMHKNVCMGGTFDGIHEGHKILFGNATKICSDRLIVGVTDTNMIKNKVLWELIAPVEERISKVKDYLQLIKPSLNYQVVSISDIYGPAVTEEELDCIVVSRETIRGANMVNKARQSKGWNELEVHVVDLVEDDNSSHQVNLERLKENKVSSSLLRIERLGSIIKEPEEKPDIPKLPYMIGLTGGIASGKTSIGKYLESKGFGYINHDLLGHKTYEQVGSVIYNQIVDYFGTSILDETTRAIERSRLGKIVFADRSKLDKLNEIVWPGIYSLADKMMVELGSKHDVIVVESALLIESGRVDRYHQVWTSIIPVEEAIKRQVEGRGLSPEEAERRVKAQLDNLTRVKASNAVFCTLWEVEFTHQQVDKCVNELREKYLKKI